MPEEDVKELIPVSEELPEEDYEGEDDPGDEPEMAPGTKTDPALLLKSLKEEREKRRLLEQELDSFKKTPESDDIYSDEGKVLKKEIQTLNERIEVKEIIEQFPQIKGKYSEFMEFKRDYPGISTERVAKLFLSESGLATPKIVRKGLEKASGGSREATPQGITTEDVANLRTTNFRKYSQMVREGKIKI